MRRITSMLMSGFVLIGLVALAACDPASSSLMDLDEEASASSHTDNGQLSGNISVEWTPNPNNRTGEADITVHDGPAASSSHGKFEWDAFDQNGNLVREMTITLTASDVEQTNDEATFVGTVTFDSNGGRLEGVCYVFFAADGGDPGPGNDEIWWVNDKQVSGLDCSLSADIEDVVKPNSLDLTITDGNLSIGP